VLTSLPRTRPVRRSAKREERPRTAAAATKATPKPAPARATADAPNARKPRAAPQAKATTRAARPAAAGAARATAQRRRSAPRRPVPPAGYAATPSDEEQRSHDLLGTAVQAAGELAQIGFAVGRQALQSMVDRLPKP
jgi:hypothetical protein